MVLGAIPEGHRQDSGSPEPGAARPSAAPAAPPATSGVLFSARSQVWYGVPGIPETDRGRVADGDMSASVPLHM
jgi:hypothetical protein